MAGKQILGLFFDDANAPYEISSHHFHAPTLKGVSYTQALDYQSMHDRELDDLQRLGRGTAAGRGGDGRLRTGEDPVPGSAGDRGDLRVPLFLPNNIAIIPTYVIAYQLGWVNTYIGMIIPIVGQTAFATLLFRQFFVGLPHELVDAARLDGAGWFGVLRRIGIPLARPAIAAYCSVTFLTAWNMYIWPLIVAPNPDLATLPVALAPLARSQYQLVPPNVGLAAAVLSTLPVLLVFLLTQRWYVRGVVGTGVD